jgi:hypothetical protein
MRARWARARVCVFFCLSLPLETKTGEQDVLIISAMSRGFLGSYG